MRKQRRLDRRADRIRYTINESDKTIGDIAEHLHRSPSTVYGWMNHRVSLHNADLLMQLAEYLDTSFAWLAHGMGSERHSYAHGEARQAIIRAFDSASPRLQLAIFDMVAALKEEMKESR